MRKIVLLCSAGLSTSMLVEKMKLAAEKLDLDCEISAHPISAAVSEGSSADVVLLGPQVRFQVDSVKEQVNCPVEAINIADYGMMNGESVIKRAYELIEEEL